MILNDRGIALQRIKVLKLVVVLLVALSRVVLSLVLL